MPRTASSPAVPVLRKYADAQPAPAPVAADTRTRYYEMLETAAKRKSMTILMRNQWVGMMIHRVLAAKQMVTQNKRVMHPLKEAILNYDVITVRSEYRLVEKPKKLTDIPKLIVPLEHTYKIVMKAHLSTNHGGNAEIQQYITNSNHIVSSICASVITRACRKCLLKEDQEVPQMPFEDHSPQTALVDIIDMTFQADKSFNHILVYQDLRTKFLQLRPLTTDNIAKEVAMELIKIITDFERVKSLVTPRQLEPVLKEVVVQLNLVLDSNFSLQTCETDKYPVTIRVITEIERWINDNTKEWSIGCYLVQWNMNIDHGDDFWTPYEKFFGLLQFGDCHISYDDEGGITTLMDNDTAVVRDGSIDSKKKRTHAKGKSVNVKDAQLKAEAEFIMPDVIDCEASSSDSPPTVNSIEEASVMEIFEENGTENEWEEGNEGVCCTCKEEVDEGIRIFCTVCKRCLHMYCGVRVRRAEDIYEHICFICVKPLAQIHDNKTTK